MTHMSAHPKEMFRIDNANFPKQDKHSVDVGHQ